MKRPETQSLEESKKPKTAEMPDKFFTPVGEAVESVQAEPSNEGLTQTGAQDAMGHPVQEIESLCMNCQKTGTTRLLLTSIPFFREIVIMSFSCPHCGFRNSEVQSAGRIQDKGSRYTLKIENEKDFNRQVVKSDTCVCKFVELDIEIPAKKGQLTNVEGLLSEVVEDLERDQPVRQHVQPEIYDKVEGFLAKTKSYLHCEPGTLPLTLVLDDPSGNSWIEFVPGEPSHKWSAVEYARTPEQNVELGLASPEEAATKPEARNPSSAGFISDQTDIENFENEVQTFQATCSSCYQPCATHMKKVDIPHFKEVILMSTVCDHCGYRSNEVKTGGEIPAKGRKITLKVDDPEDLNRDILKSETCALDCPELGLDLTAGTLGGRFTTLEGLLRQVYDELHTRVFTETSDSMDQQTKTKWESFFTKLNDGIEGKIPFTVIMDDPLAASYIQNVYAPDPDPNMKVEEVERTHEQNEDLGLLDIDVDQK